MPNFGGTSPYTGLSPAAIKTAGYTAAPGEMVPGDTTTAGFTVTLPTSPPVGAQVGVYKTDSSTNILTIVPSGTGTIDGDANAQCLTKNAGATVEHLGGDAWKTVSLYSAAGAAGYLRTSDAAATYAALAGANVFAARQSVVLPGGVATAFSVGTGTSRGAPTGTITAIANGAGTITSTAPGRKWAYTEIDSQGGETTLSPASGALSLTAQQAKLTVPFIRPGMVDRKVYASDDNGVTWKLVGNVNTTGGEYYSQTYLDNVSAPTTTAPVTDTTKHEAVSVSNDGMVYLRRTNNVSDVSDLTILMANPANSGSLCIDSYGQILARTGNAMPGFTARYKGSVAGNPFQAYWAPDDGLNSTAVQTWRVQRDGSQVILGHGLDWGGPGLQIAPTVAQTAGTAGLLQIVVPASSTNHGMTITQSGTGDVLRNSTATFRVLPDGSINASGGSGANYLPDVRTLTRLVLGAPSGYNGSNGILVMGDSSNPPTVITSGGVLYSAAGALKWRGSSGTVTTIAPA